MSDREFDFQTLTGPVRNGEIPWTVAGFRAASMIVMRARSGRLKLPPAVAGLPAEVLQETAIDELALGLWLRREHSKEAPEIPAAHHLRFHAIEAFLALNSDLLLEEGLLKPAANEDDDPVPDPLLLEELVARPYDAPLTAGALPGFDTGEVLKAVARRARGD